MKFLISWEEIERVLSECVRMQFDTDNGTVIIVQGDDKIEVEGTPVKFIKSEVRSGFVN